MTKLISQNMTRKDGDAHQTERKADFSTLSSKTVQTIWEAKFKAKKKILESLAPKRNADLVKDLPRL